MSDAANTAFTSEELLSQAQGNANALALTTVAYLKERGLAVDEYFAFVGQQFAPGWEELRGRSVMDVARIAALNMVSVGGTLRSLSGNVGEVWKVEVVGDQIEMGDLSSIGLRRMLDHVIGRRAAAPQIYACVCVAGGCGPTSSTGGTLS